MLPINKKPEPAGLHVFKKQNKGRVWPPKPSKSGPYEDFTGWKRVDAPGDSFDELRRQLLAEQFHACAYCGKSIGTVSNEYGNPQMKVEHFSPKDNTIENDLEYQNLLGVCLGNQNSTAENHCDSSKGESKLNHVKNPALTASRDRRIIYKIKPSDQEVLVLAQDERLNTELKTTLNLNEQGLAARRFLVWQNKIQKRLGANWTLAKLQSLRQEYNQPYNGKNVEFKDLLIWYLDREISRNA